MSLWITHWSAMKPQNWMTASLTKAVHRHVSQKVWLIYSHGHIVIMVHNWVPLLFFLHDIFTSILCNFNLALPLHTLRQAWELISEAFVNLCQSCETLTIMVMHSTKAQFRTFSIRRLIQIQQILESQAADGAWEMLDSRGRNGNKWFRDQPVRTSIGQSTIVWLIKYRLARAMREERPIMVLSFKNPDLEGVHRVSHENSSIVSEDGEPNYTTVVLAINVVWSRVNTLRKRCRVSTWQ